MTRSVQSSLEAHAEEIGVVDVSGTLHEGPDEIVGNEVDKDFLLDHLGALAAQDVHAQGDLDLMEVKLNIPTFGVKFAQVIGRVNHRIA